jgi:phage baseplate assembly protein W
MATTDNGPIGMDAETGRIIRGWDHTVQQINRIMWTAFHEWPMRPYRGSNARLLIGELANVRTALRFRKAVGMAIMLFVPNYRPVRIDQVGLDRTGDTSWVIDGYYMPRGHLGDRTIADRRDLTFSFSGRNGPTLTG